MPLIFIVSLCSRCATTASRDCAGSGWLSLGNGSYCLSNAEEKLPWTKAIQACQAKGAGLVTMHRSENVKKLLKVLAGQSNLKYIFNSIS